MNMILKVILASSFGALVSISLGKYVSDQSGLLILWAILGAFVGFLSVDPLEFCRKFKGVLLEKIEEHKCKLIENRLFREACLIQVKGLFVSLGIMCSILLWFYPVASVTCFLLFTGMGNEFIHDFSLLYFYISLICLTLMSFAWIRDFSGSTDFSHFVDIYNFSDSSEFYKVHLKDRLDDNVVVFKKCLFLHREIGKYLKQFSKEAFIFLSWVKTNGSAIGKILIYSFMITCYVISSVHRWNAVIGSISGFIIGWISGRSEIIGMISGGAFGALIYLVTSYVASKIPKDGIVFPELVPVAESD